MLYRTGRFTRLAEIQAMDPATEYSAIYRITALFDLPSDVRTGLLLGFWRTFAVPAVAEILYGTGKSINRTRKRADDTALIIYNLIHHGTNSPEGAEAIRIMNAIHSRWNIREEDYLYVLGTFIFPQVDWLQRHGWRSLCCHEKESIYLFYRDIGTRMGIMEIPGTFEEYKSWYIAFEAKNFASTPAGIELMKGTRDLLNKMPAWLVPLAQRMLPALLDEKYRTVVGLEGSPRWATRLLNGLLWVRAKALRHAAAPRVLPDRADMRRLRRPSSANPS
ncbi:oxygenase MpaB family protein [Paractinoplanes hotanensis]|uniref:DUF2236 domain-containing protein n=1 Tax=Paractinoplanes hotanensis TaxID=2906497 RepID=A0ABT0YCY4_9ACTN|nr:oxygenase MpaB family protein [Actinoplanes hotanensis]MCM4083922.1 DUF2236 domain-containing protein [Actinoplanes hotanensis]